MGFETYYYPLIFLISFLGFFVKSISGFGDPLITAPLFSLFLDNRIISPCNLLLGLPVNGHIAWKSRKSFSVKFVLPILGWILLGVVPGVILLKHAASWILKAVLGVVILGIGLEMISRDEAKQSQYSPVKMAIISFFSGVTAGLFGINLFFVAYLARTAKNRDEFRGNICFVFFFEALFRMAAYIISGVFNKSAFVLFAAALPGMVLGYVLGSSIDKKLSDAVVNKLVITLFMLSGLTTLIKAVV